MKTKKTLLMAMAILVMTFIFGGCQKDGGGKLESGRFNGTISATVENDAPGVGLVVAWNDAEISGGYLHGEQASDPATYSGNSFTLKLPNTPPSGCTSMTVKSVFENEMGISGAKFSDPGVRIVGIDILGFNSAGDAMYGFFMQITPDEKMQCIYLYAEGDVTVTGGSNLKVSFEEGWNRLYISDKLITTKAQSGLVWYFNELE